MELHPKYSELKDTLNKYPFAFSNQLFQLYLDLVYVQGYNEKDQIQVVDLKYCTLNVDLENNQEHKHSCPDCLVRPMIIAKTAKEFDTLTQPHDENEIAQATQFKYPNSETMCFIPSRYTESWSMATFENIFSYLKVSNLVDLAACKFTLAIVGDDSSIVYYGISDSIIPPTP